MNHKKTTYYSKTRKDISSPFNNISHSSLLELANVKCFNGNFVVQKLQNDKIIVKPILYRKELKK
jgi:hypothetical protein